MGKRLLMMSASPFILLGASATTQAQVSTDAEAPGDDEIGAIVVTAQKRAESIQNVPLSIQAVSGEALKAAGVNDPTQLGKLVPSLQISNNGVIAAGLSIRIRGFGTPANGSTDSDVAAYVDGAYIPRPGALLNSFLDVKSVEVLNGPQGTLFGRNAAMGAISINTTAPAFEHSLSASVEGGTFGAIGGTVIANAALSDVAAIRFAGKYSHTDGRFFNRLDQKTYGRRNDYVGRLSLLVDVTPDLTWILRADAAKTTGDGVNPQAVYVNTATPAQLAAFTGFLNIFGATPPVYSSRPSYEFNQTFGNPYLKNKQWGIINDINWNMSPVLAARLINTYRDWDNDQLSGDTIATALDILSVRQKFSSKAQSHELQLISDRDAFVGGKLGFTAGVYYFEEDYGLDTSFNLGTQFCPILVGGNAPALVPACLALPQTDAGFGLYGQNTKSFAIYGQVNYNIAPDLTLDLGARQTWDKKTAVLDNSPTNPIALFPIMVDEPAYNFKLKENKPSFRASLSWQAADRTMLFAHFATGYKSGGFNNAASGFAPTAASRRVFDSESVQDYEVGVKTTFWDGKAQINATAFYTRLNDFQDRSFDGQNFLTRNSGDVKSKGIDIDSRFRPIPNLTLRLAATYLDAKYIKNEVAPTLEGCSATGTPVCPVVPSTPPNPLTQDLSGQRLQYSPKLQGSAGFDLALDDLIGGGYHATLSGTQHRTSSFLTSNTNNPASRLPGWWTTDLSFSIATPDEGLKLEIYGTNIFNKHYYQATLPQILGVIFGVNDATTGSTLYRGFLGDPRQIGARVTANF